MADIIVKIAINPSGTGAIGAVSTNNYELLNNISIKTDDTGTFEVLTDDKFQGTEMLAFNKGLLHFNSAGFLSNRKDGEAGRLQSSKNPRQYVWSRTDDNGYALGKDNNPVEIVLTLESSDPSVGFDSIVIIGDFIAKQFPVEAYLDDSTQPIYSNDAKWAIKFDENKTTHTIRFTRWNRPNYNAVLSSIRVMYKYINIGDSALQSISSLAQTTSDVSTLNYGVIANSGSIEMIDGNGEIEDLIRDGILPNSDVELEVQYNGKTIQHHITSDTDYKSDTKEFNLSLTNKVKDLDILIYDGLEYKNSQMSLYDILYDVMKSLNGGNLELSIFDEMLSNKCVYSIIEMDIPISKEDTILNYLKSILVKYPVIEYGNTYRKIIDDICTVAQLRMFVNNDNKYEFVSARPILYSDDTPIEIKPKVLREEATSDVVVKNKYDGVEMTETYIEDKIQYNVEVYALKNQPINPKYDDYNKDTKKEYFDDSKTSYIENTARVESYYVEGSQTFYKQDQNKLDSIKGVFTPELNEEGLLDKNVSLNYSIKEYSNESTTSDVYNLINILEDGEFFVEKFDYSKTLGTGVLTKPLIEQSIFTTSVKAELNDESYIKVVDNGDSYTISYKILSGKLEALGTKQYLTNNIYTYGIFFKKFMADSLTISLFGDERTITFKDISASSENIENKKNKAKINSNRLLQTETTFYGYKLSDIIKNNIMLDYQTKGIKGFNIKTICSQIKKDIGETLNLTDVIYLSKNGLENQRVVSRNFIYDGEPYLELQTEELITHLLNGGLFDLDKTVVKKWNDLILDGDITLDSSNTKILGSNTNISGILAIDIGIKALSYQSLMGSKYNKIILPVGLESIDYGTFANCKSLSEISIPNSVEFINSNVFDGCDNLKFNIYNNVKYLGNSKNKHSALVSVDEANKNLRVYDIHKDTKIIASSAFKDCLNLVRISIPDSVKLGYSVFYGCSSLSFALLPSDLETISSSLFSECVSLQIVNIPKTVKLIDNYAFNNCNKLSQVDLPNDLEAIGNYVFYNCSSLKTIFIPKNVKNIGQFAFYGCSGLSEVIFEDPTGWTVNGTSINLNNSTTNVAYITNTYANSNWVKN